MERRFPIALANVYLTADHVTHQLRQRYLKEIQRGCRPILRKVLNRDVAASTPMVLCVSRVDHGDFRKDRETRLCLSDGWYEIPALIDEHLQQFVDDGKINVGTKIVTCNAILEGADDGVDPLDKSYRDVTQNFSVRIKLFANSTRKCKWSSKLGFVAPHRTKQMIDGALRIYSFDHIVPGGGAIPIIDVILCKRYPIMYMYAEEENGSRTNRLVTEGEHAFNQKKFEEIQNGIVEQNSESTREGCMKEVDEHAPQVWQAMISSSSPDLFYNKLDESQQHQVDTWNLKRKSLIQEKTNRSIMSILQNQDDTVQGRPFIRFLCRCMGKDWPTTGHKLESTEAILTIWNPTDDQINNFDEGCVVRCKNLGAKSPAGIMQLVAQDNRSVQQIQPQPSIDYLMSIGYEPRCYPHLMHLEASCDKHMLSSPNRRTPEFDCAGCFIKAIKNAS